jgi:hypothetical protein
MDDTEQRTGARELDCTVSRDAELKVPPRGVFRRMDRSAQPGAAAPARMREPGGGDQARAVACCSSEAGASGARNQRAQTAAFVEKEARWLPGDVSEVGDPRHLIAT